MPRRRVMVAMSFPQERIRLLAKKLGISFQEAASLCAKKGARVRRERAAQCACRPDAKPPRYWWQEND